MKPNTDLAVRELLNENDYLRKVLVRVDEIVRLGADEGPVRCVERDCVVAAVGIVLAEAKAAKSCRLRAARLKNGKVK